MARTDPQVNFRMPQELRDQLEDACKESKRTLTAEIIYRLKQSLDKGYMPSPGAWGHANSDGTVTFRDAKAMLDELAELTQRASMLVSIFQNAQTEAPFPSDEEIEQYETTSRSALSKNLAAAVESVGKSRTPTIPGVNIPKRGSKQKP
jgi:hypothetical protein